jgi:MoxR-like ATPase
MSAAPVAVATQSPIADYPELDELQEVVTEASGWIPAILAEMSKMVVGQQHLLERLIIGLLSNAHVLLEGVPGLAKTTAVKALASCIQAQFSRIQLESERQEALKFHHSTSVVALNQDRTVHTLSATNSAAKS